MRILNTEKSRANVNAVVREIFGCCFSVGAQARISFFHFMYGKFAAAVVDVVLMLRLMNNFWVLYTYDVYYICNMMWMKRGNELSPPSSFSLSLISENMFQISIVNFINRQSVCIQTTTYQQTLLLCSRGKACKQHTNLWTQSCWERKAI